MMTILACVTLQHDNSIVVLAGLLCAFGAWVTARLYRQALSRPALIWYLLTASVAGVSIWCTHFVAMLGFLPNVPVTFDIGLTFASLLIAILGSTVAIICAVRLPVRFAPVLGGALLGLAISGMHYAGMIAYRVQGLVYWRLDYLVASIVLAVVLSAVALYCGARAKRWGEGKMTVALTLGIVTLHFTGMTAFVVSPLDIAGDFVNPQAFRTLAVAVAGVAMVIVMGALFVYLVESRTRMESIAELTAARIAAENASRAKSEFLSVLSHELRTPLTIVLGYAGIMTKLKESHAAAAGGIVDLQASRMGDQAELYGRKITGAATHLLTLINEILDYTTMELGDAKLTKSPFAVGDLLAEVEDQFRAPMADRAIALRVSTDEIMAFADRGRCRQILVNLVGNAVKFSKSTEIHLRAQMTPAGFTLEVEDLGCGIAEDDLDRIFEAFQQLENADNRHQGGTGLGLAICRKLAIAHGGDIAVRSTVGVGTLFTVSFPESAIDRSGFDLGLGELRKAG